MRSLAALLLPLCLSAAACGQDAVSGAPSPEPPGLDLPSGAEVAVFAAGCFWCTEADFEDLDGVLDAVSGFTGGTVPDPDYYDVVAGGTGHVEAVRIVFDPAEVSYAQLLDHYWHNVDPLDGAGQFCDRGSSYAPVIFTTTPEQADTAEASRQRIQTRFDAPVEVRIREASAFWPAEDYHQDYAQTNPLRYQRYRFGCRRDQRLRELWGDAAGAH